MGNKYDFVDNVLIKLKRKYGKDEVISALAKQLTDKDVEIGKLKSEIDYLNSELEEKKIDKKVGVLRSVR